MKKFMHFLGFAILSLSMTIFLTSCPGPDDITNPWWPGQNPDDPSTPVNPGDPSNPVDPSNPSSDPTQFSGNIDANTTWPDLGLPIDYVVSGTLRVRSNALLTIEPGVTIMFDSNSGNMVVEENAGISMVGTPDKPIVFTGPTNNPNNGSWNRVIITSVRNDNRLEYVQFIRGGSQTGNWRAPVEITGKVHMNNCLIDGSLSNGITTASGGSFYSFDNNTIKNCADYPWRTENHASLYDGIGNNNIFINNGKNMVCVSTGNYYFLEDHVTLKRMSVPYLFDNGFDLRGAYKYTIEPGTTMLFGSNQGFRIDEPTTFIADGTVDAPITICGKEDEPGYWNGIIYYSNKQASIMNYVNISGSGYGSSWSESSNLYIAEGERRLTITNCVISNSQYYGIHVGSPEIMQNITHNNIVFSNCQGGNVRFYYGGEYNGVTYEAGQILPQLP